MRVKNKIFLVTLIVLLSSSFLVNCSISTATPEDNTYLTPIPESTLLAYHEKRPINTKLDAVLEAHSDMEGWRLRFTQGAPEVVFVDAMTLSEANKRIPEDAGESYPHESRSDDTRVWLVVFNAQWQVYPPNGDLLPLESGCIYLVLEAEDYGFTYGHISKKNCLSTP